MSMQALVIDDDLLVRELVGDVLREEGWEVTEVESAENAFEILRDREWSVVFCDVVLGGTDGFSVLHSFQQQSPGTKVVLMTGHPSAEGALDATAFGAYDYLLKPFDVEELQTLSRALKEQFANRRSRSTGQRGAAGYKSSVKLVGRSEVFIELMKQVGRVAATNLSVLLTGESGTGKEVVASALHRRSSRAAQPFVAVHCGSIPAELLESELFGHVKGSFTWADRGRLGLWEGAEGGTVFLDEITDTTPAFQVKLLRVLQESEIWRVGSNEKTRVDVRVIAATDRDVEQEVESGRFRKDLFYRLNAVSIVLPPLRDRREDILPLAKSFAERVYSLNSVVGFSPEAVALLEKYSWPGNIRELENVIVRAAAMCDGTIRAQDLPEQVRLHSETKAATADLQGEGLLVVAGEWPLLAEVEGRYVALVLGHTKGNKQAAARILGTDRKTLDRKIKRHHIPSNR
ncbi:MAG: Sigma-54 dependent DNA-binding response regulator [Acidobacteria bacterium]|nr:Sigma-54 dependent DNA-binding response regulator [Acidobacteriota bacterium]